MSKSQRQVDLELDSELHLESIDLESIGVPTQISAEQCKEQVLSFRSQKASSVKKLQHKSAKKIPQIVFAVNSKISDQKAKQIVNKLQSLAILNDEKQHYLKQIATKIRNELKTEQKQAEEIQLIQGTYIKPVGRKIKMTKKTLSLLASIFNQQFNSNQKNASKPLGVTMNEIADLFRISLSQTTRMYRIWRNDYNFIKFSSQMDDKLNFQKKLFQWRIQQIARILKQNPFLTQFQITTELNKIHDLKAIRNGRRAQMARTTVARLLRFAKFKKKKVNRIPRQRNTFWSIEARHNYCIKFKKLLNQKNRNKIFFLDQSGFNMNIARDKAWSRPDDSVNVNCPQSKANKYSLLAVISMDGLASWQIIEGSFCKQRFLDFLREFLMELVSQDNKHITKYLIMDNCTIHSKGQTQKLSKQYYTKVLFLPPYSSKLNPIQSWFQQVKQKIRNMGCCRQTNKLEQMKRILKRYENYDFSSYYASIFKHVNKGIDRIDF